MNDTIYIGCIRYKIYQLSDIIVKKLNFHVGYKLYADYLLRTHKLVDRIILPKRY